MEKSSTSTPAANARAGLTLAALALLAACAGAQGDAAPPPSAAPAPPQATTAPLPPLASPIDDALPSLIAPNLPQRATCRIGTCMLSNPVPEELLKTLPERGPLMLWEQRLGSRARIAFPADKEVELAGVVLEGSVGLLSSEKQWGGTPEKMTQWQGFYAPGGGVTLTAMDKNPARIALVISIVTQSTEPSLAGHIGRWRKSMKPFVWKQRAKAIKRVDFTSIPAVSWEKGAYHARIGWEVPGDASGGKGAQDASAEALAAAPSMVMNLLRFSKDADVADHVHDKAWECIAFLEGGGELQLSPAPPGRDRAANAGQSVTVEPGMVASIPNGIWHAFKSSGTSPLLAIQVYSPPGPELRFKQLADKAR